MSLYQPMNGWDGHVLVATTPDVVFADASEVYHIEFTEKFNTERRKQLGTHSPGYMPGRYEASGKASGYFISGAMATKLYGVSDKTARRDHAARPMIQYNIHIDFSGFPITVKDAVGSVAAIKLVGYILSGCIVDSDTFTMEESTYVEKPFDFMIQRVYDVYDTDIATDWAPFIV